MLCQEVMNTNVQWVGPQTSIEDAARIMRDQDIGFLPVCDETRRVYGTITDRDIVVRVVADGESPKQAVENFLTVRIIACRPTDDLSHAEELMSQEKVSRMMCVNELGELQGVLSLSDIAQVEDATRAAATLRSVTEREAQV